LSIDELYNFAGFPFRTRVFSLATFITLRREVRILRRILGISLCVLGGRGGGNGKVGEEVVDLGIRFVRCEKDGEEEGEEGERQLDSPG